MVSGVIEALTKAASQLGDRAVLAVLAKSVVITLVVFVIAVIGFWLLLDAAIEAWIIAYLPDDYSNVVAGLVAVSVGLVAFWILFRVVAVAVLQFFADEVVAAVEARHYPEAAERAKPLPFAKDLANSLKGIGRTVAINLSVPVLRAIARWVRCVPAAAPKIGASKLAKGTSMIAATPHPKHTQHTHV